MRQYSDKDWAHAGTVTGIPFITGEQIHMEFRSNTFGSTVLTITPDLAEEMLATSVGNRRLRPWYVELYAGMIARGEWRLTHQGAAFDKEGHLRDGFHRLNAIVRANATVPMMVTVGLDAASFDAIDQGLARTVGDVLGLDKAISEPLRYAATLVAGKSRVTAPQVVEAADTGLLQAVERINDFCPQKRRYFSAAPIRCAAGIALMRGFDSEHVLTQYRAMIIGTTEMTEFTHAFVRQITTGKITGYDKRSYFARALLVFDPERKDFKRLSLTTNETESLVSECRLMLVELISERNKGRGGKRREAPSWAEVTRQAA